MEDLAPDTAIADLKVGTRVSLTAVMDEQGSRAGNVSKSIGHTPGGTGPTKRAVGISRSE